MTTGNEWLTVVVPVPFQHIHRSSQFLAEAISAEVMQVPVIVYDKNG